MIDCSNCNSISYVNSGVYKFNVPEPEGYDLKMFESLHKLHFSLFCGPTLDSKDLLSQSCICDLVNETFSQIKLSNMKYIIIDGLIGAGKTTLLKKFHEKFHCIGEPIEKWNEFGYLNLSNGDYIGSLQLFYKHLKCPIECINNRWIYFFQLIALFTRLSTFLINKQTVTVLCERSPCTDM